MMKVKVIRYKDHIYITKKIDNEKDVWQAIVTIDPTVTYVGGPNGIKTIDKCEDFEIVQLMLGTCQGYHYEFRLD